MTKTKFTPGEWIIVHSTTSTNIYSDDGWICELDNETSKSEANALLITQAPEMYAELEMIAANLPIINKHLPMNVVGVEGMISRINALLSAARGETTKP